MGGRQGEEITITSRLDNIHHDENEFKDQPSAVEEILYERRSIDHMNEL